jgi:hypothetical protein
MTEQPESTALVVDSTATVIDQTTGEIVPAVTMPALVRPIAEPEEIVAAWKQFEDLKQRILTHIDFQEIQGKPRILKSGWRKIAAAFGISDQLVQEERREYTTAGGQPYFVWEVTARAIAPNGRYADAVGSCASNERRFSHLDHDTRATAHTRAKNRAVSDLVGGGEVSAEEFGAEFQAGGQPASTPGAAGRADPTPRTPLPASAGRGAANAPAGTTARQMPPGGPEKPAAAPAAGKPPPTTTQTCEQCGDTLQTITFQNGDKWTPADLARISKKKHGQVLCMAHLRDANARRQAKQADAAVPF